jgi:hypothetical protein
LSIVFFRFGMRGPAPPKRAPLLEVLLARAGAAQELTDWRVRAFHVIAPELAMPPVASAALCAVPGGGGSFVFIATPVHVIAGMRSTSMPADGILDLEPAEADALAGDFNQVFLGAGVRLVRGLGSLLLLLFDVPLRVATLAPEEVLGRDLLACMPRGVDAARVRRLMSEIEMWLHEHAVNQHRRARAAPPITGLWLWGGGTTDLSLPAVHGWTAGSDPLFTAFQMHPQDAAAASGVVVIADSPGTAAWARAEQEWLEPAMAALRAGRVRQIELSAGHQCFSVSGRRMWRFWRRPRPWWEFFDSGVSLDDRD